MSISKCHCKQLCNFKVVHYCSYTWRNLGTWNSIFTVTGAIAPNVLQWQLVKEVSVFRKYYEQVILAQICKLKLEVIQVKGHEET